MIRRGAGVRGAGVTAGAIPRTGSRVREADQGGRAAVTVTGAEVYGTGTGLDGGRAGALTGATAARAELTRAADPFVRRRGRCRIDWPAFLWVRRHGAAPSRSPP